MKATVKELLDQWDWKPIRNCPGRFVLRRLDPSISFAAILGPDHQIQKFRSPLTKDEVLVVKLEDGGLITYARSDGSLLHTLNTEEGFRRKIAQLNITFQPV